MKFHKIQNVINLARCLLDFGEQELFYWLGAVQIVRQNLTQRRSKDLEPCQKL